MQVVYGPNAANVLITAQKRLIRPLYAQTQGFPYAAVLDPSFRNTDGSFRAPLATDVAGTAVSGGTAPAPLTRASAVFLSQGSVVPGTVMVKAGGSLGGVAGEYVAVSNAANAIQPFGLLGQWLGGTFDNVGQNNQVGVWMGPDSVYELLAPAWNDTGVATAIAAAGAGVPVLMYAQADGRLGTTNTGSQVAVCRIIDRPSAARLVVQMLV